MITTIIVKVSRKRKLNLNADEQQSVHDSLNSVFWLDLFDTDMRRLVLANLVGLGTGLVEYDDGYVIYGSPPMLRRLESNPTTDIGIPETDANSIVRFITEHHGTVSGDILSAAPKSSFFEKRAIAINARAISMGLENIVSWQDLMDTYVICNAHCFSCNNRLKVKDMEVDHILPLSKFGIHEWWNMQWLCKSCNRAKHTRMPEQVDGGATMIGSMTMAILFKLYIQVNLNLIAGQSHDSSQLADWLAFRDRIERIITQDEISAIDVLSLAVERPRNLLHPDLLKAPQ
ncbi:MAG: HNH endonuclease signature motif containing protein [Chloroflexota bacterium]|nr:HNH endonuclease signature motif containing protein [Chloroflexota bacterium]